MNLLRQERIKEYIREKEIVTIQELRELCPEVTLMTIHRDLDALQNTGALVKMRGGARTVLHSGDPAFELRVKTNLQAKELIASKALSLIQPGSSIFLDAGTTTLALAKALPDINLTIFTTGPNFAIEMNRLSNSSINICCGNLNRANLALSGQNTLDMLKTVNIDLAFIGASGYTKNAGFTCGKESEMLVKRLVMQKARTSAVLMDTTKLGLLMPFTFAHLQEPDYIISDGMLPKEFILAVQEAKTVLL